MTKVKSIALGTAAAMFMSSLAFSAQAATPLYSGGGTLAEKIYRDLMNCYGEHGGGAAPGDTAANLAGAPTGCNTVAPYNANVGALYVGVGSGNGKAGFVNHNAALYTFNGSAKTPDNPPVPSTTDFGAFYGTGTGTGWVRNTTGTGTPFPSVTFSGSDDPLTSGDVTTYNTNNTTSKGWGAPHQFPALITVITFPYGQTADWNAKGTVPAGGGNSGLVDLSTNTLCGIFSGAITTWNDPAITIDNNGNVLGTGAITVVYRSDSSGSTFLTSNGLINQCAVTAHPIPATWQTATGNASGAGNNSWFINVKTAALLPANFVGASGSGGVKTAINGTAGSIGYVSPDFAQPIDTTGPKAANLQTFASVGGTAVWKAPSAKNGTLIMNSAKPPSFTKNFCLAGNKVGDKHITHVAPWIETPDGICADNPLNWGVTNPKPTNVAAYPIGGFTFIDTYGCYGDSATFAGLAANTGTVGYLSWYYGSGAINKNHPKTELKNNGFSAVPGGWVSAIKKLLFTDTATALGQPGQASTGCASVTGTGA